MSKIKFSHNEKEYTLEYTRDSVATMETDYGLSILKMTDSVVNNMTAIIYGAFIANHPKVSKDEIDEIYSEITNKQELMEALSEMLAETVNSLFGEPKKSAKNIKWEKSR